ncbi:MAG: hypothetical protein ACFFE5_15700 [Candidatus Thorarchaeota archaeon]
MEILYLSEKKRIDISFNKTRQLIEKSTNYFIVDLTPEIIKEFKEHINTLGPIQPNEYIKPPSIEEPVKDKAKLNEL